MHLTTDKAHISQTNIHCNEANAANRRKCTIQNIEQLFLPLKQLCIISIKIGNEVF